MSLFRGNPRWWAFLLVMVTVACAPSFKTLEDASNVNNVDSTPGSPPAPSPSPAPTPVPFPAIPGGSLSAENIGTMTNISNIFNRWALNGTVTGGRGSNYADVTTSCHGKINLSFALTETQWEDSTQQTVYYRNLNTMIEQIGAQLVSDQGNVLTGAERDSFLLALKALAWQESGWQHSLRYKDWFFIFLAGSSYNALDDWGITQVARSGFTPTTLLNTSFFSSGDYCDISKALLYGFTEYYNDYIRARGLACNQTGNEMDIILGAYNEYSSGYSACHNGLSSDSTFAAYQTAAMNGLKTQYQTTPWVSFMQ